MKRPILSAIQLLFVLSVGLLAFQRGGRRQQSVYYGENVPSEFYWTRFQYNSGYGGGGGNRFGGGYGGGWSQDYPKADNDCLIALRRLTHINSPSPLNVADLDTKVLDSKDIFNYPWIYAVNVHLGLQRRRSQNPARLSFEGRFPDGRQFPRHRRLGKFHEWHAAGYPRPSGGGS